ncbi:MAG: hypothetical protein H7Z12_18260 [Rhodospirillaceae bacterium]|nr:hypothetical protein [Rhodospirillales bacterium]
MSAVTTFHLPRKPLTTEWVYDGGSSKEASHLAQVSLTVSSARMTYTFAMKTPRDHKMTTADALTAAAAIAFIGGCGWAIVSTSEYGLFVAAASMFTLAVIARRNRK